MWIVEAAALEAPAQISGYDSRGSDRALDIQFFGGYPVTSRAARVFVDLVFRLHHWSEQILLIFDESFPFRGFHLLEAHEGSILAFGGGHSAISKHRLAARARCAASSG